MNVEKLDKDIDNLSIKIKALMEKKKELEGRRKAAIDAELATVFTKKKIAAEEFLVFNRLSEEQMKKLLEQAKQITAQNESVKSETIPNTKESIEE